MKNNKTILLLTTPFRPNIGGVETHLDDLINTGIEKGWRFDVLTYQPLVTKAMGKIFEKGTGFVVLRIPWIRLNLFLRLEKYPLLEFLYLFPPLFILGFIYLIFDNSGVRKIHAQGLIAGTVGVVLGKIFRKRVILSTHSIYRFPQSGMYFNFAKFLFESCEKVLCLSQQSREEILRLGVDESKADIFTYWVDQHIFRPLPRHEIKQEAHKNLKSFLTEGQDLFICLFVGRLVAGKGVVELLKAASSIDKKVKFIVIGDGPLAKLVEQSAASLSNVIFQGKVDNSRLPEYYNLADVLIVPSTHEEGYGRVILEALSCGLPVIATNRGGVREYITNKIGVLINVTSQNIGGAIRSLYNNPDKLKKMKVNAYNYAKIHFNKKNCQIIFNHYE